MHKFPGTKYVTGQDTKIFQDIHMGLLYKLTGFKVLDGVTNECYLLRSNAVQSGRSSSTIRKNILPSSSELKTKSSK